MKLPVAMCDPRPGRFGPIVAVPTTASSSTATTTRPCPIQSSRARSLLGL